MSCAIDCGQTALTHSAENLDCDGLHPAGSQDLILFFCLDDVSDITDPSQINNALNQGSALRVELVKFGSDLPTPTLGPKATSCGVPKVLYVTSTMTITDYSYNQENNELYNELGAGRGVAAVLARDCQTNANYADTSRYYVPTSGNISFAGGLSSADDDDEAAFFQVTGTYKGGVTIIATPAGVFV